MFDTDFKQMQMFSKYKIDSNILQSMIFSSQQTVITNLNNTDFHGSGYTR